MFCKNIHNKEHQLNKINSEYQLNKINPITTVGLILLFSVVLTIGNKIEYLTVLSISLVCLMNFSFQKSIRSIIAVLVTFGVIYLIRPHVGNVFLGSIYTMLIIILKYIPIFILGKIMAAYSSSYLMAALRKIGIRGNINIGITIFFRFIPEIFIRIREIHDGLNIRGFKASILRPIKSFELYFVPLLYKCIDVSDTLTCSIISKGMEYDCDKTSYHSVCFTIFDKLILVIGVILFGVSVWKQF